MKINTLWFLLLTIPNIASAGFYSSVAAKGGLGTAAAEDESFVESRDLYHFGAELNLGWHWRSFVVGASAEYVMWNQKTKTSEVGDVNMSGKQFALSPMAGIGLGKFLILAKVPMKSTLTLNEKDAAGNEVAYTDQAFPAYGLQLNYRLANKSYIGLEYTKTTYKTMQVDGDDVELEDEQEVTYSGWGLVYGYVF